MPIQGRSAGERRIYPPICTPSRIQCLAPDGEEEFARILGAALEDLQMFRRLRLEALEDRCVPATVVWTDALRTHNWEDGGNWGNGIGPDTQNDIAQFGGSFPGSQDYCDCLLSGQVCKGIIMNSYYDLTTSRLHFNADSSSTVIVGAAGIQMVAGGIEQDNGCTLETDGGGAMTGGEINAESGASATFAIKGSNATFGVNGTTTPPNHDFGSSLEVATTDTFELNIGTDNMRMLKNANIIIDADATGVGTMNWKAGNITIKDPSTTDGIIYNHGVLTYADHGTAATTETCALR